MSTRAPYMGKRPVIAYTFPPSTPTQTVGPLTQYVVGFFQEAGDPPVENLYVSKHADKALTATPGSASRAYAVALRVGGEVKVVYV